MAFNANRFLLPGSTNIIDLRGLRYADGDKEPVESNATIHLTIYNTGIGATPVTGESWPKNMTVAGDTTEEDGTVVPLWRCTISHLAAIFRNRQYRVEATADAPNGSRRVFSALYSAKDSDH